MPPAIRRATVNDIPAIRNIEQQAASAAHWPAQEYAKMVSSGLVLVAEQEGELCGFACAKSVAGEWELENVVVAPPFQRQGVADSLVRSLLNEVLQAGGASKVVLEVRESNLPARRLYEKHGFRETGRRRNYYQNPSENAILYECRLN
jgi:ribosomal-protein-alanine N-acetyltransferase